MCEPRRTASSASLGLASFRGPEVGLQGGTPRGSRRSSWARADEVGRVSAQRRRRWRGRRPGFRGRWQRGERRAEFEACGALLWSGVRLSWVACEGESHACVVRPAVCLQPLLPHLVRSATVLLPSLPWPWLLESVGAQAIGHSHVPAALWRLTLSDIGGSRAEQCSERLIVSDRGAGDPSRTCPRGQGMR